ncbi:MAG: YraN family protein [Calditrichaeota bacterium]|nr:MAG: YraN family protein [Calditrichota bacterium]MBL1206682.1 YraN family protein [Calditrichota bacterium]NOG46509.1 YraN family protein [Calditrichota bacterium]
MGNKTANQVLGKKGEQLAKKYLEQAGHNIIAENYRSGRSELDIISQKDSTVVVSEVKSFYSKPLGAAEFRVNKRKQQQIIKGVYGFLSENPKYEGQDVRLDVIVVDFSSYPANITHHQSAFYDDGDY